VGNRGGHILKKKPGWPNGQPGVKPFLLSHAKAPLREEKRDAVTVGYQHRLILVLLDKSSFLKLT
jgi:hypothetical protein